MSGQRPPKISVIIPTYNRGDLLGEAVRSVLNQTFTDLELIVVDDGSTDDTAEVMAALAHDQRVRYLRQPHRGRGAAARNNGIRHSRGELIGFLDDDDVWLPTKLQRQLDALAAEPRAAVAWCAVHIQHLAADGSIRTSEVRRYRPERYREPLTGPFVHAPASTLLVRAECFDRVGLFDERLGCCDMDMTQRLGAAYTFVCLDEPLAVYRIRPISMSADPTRMVWEWRRYMARLRRRTPPRCHHLIPVAFLIRNSGWMLGHLRAGQLDRAGALCWRTLGIAVRDPMSPLRALRSYAERWWKTERHRPQAAWYVVSPIEVAGTVRSSHLSHAKQGLGSPQLEEAKQSGPESGAAGRSEPDPDSEPLQALEAPPGWPVGPAAVRRRGRGKCRAAP